MRQSMLWALTSLILLLCLTSCGGVGRRATTAPRDPLANDSVQDESTGEDVLALQSHVMGMADEYGAALAEAVYIMVRDDDTAPKSRWLAQSFLRNGMGAAVDIAVGPNPAVSLLDLLVLSSLQTWSFGKHWIKAGIDGEDGQAALTRLKLAERELWAAGETYLDDEHRRKLRELIAHWIEEHPDRMVVSLVRFSDFESLRRTSTLNPNEQASGLLAAIEETTQVVEDVELLGERLLWFAGRLPYLIGQQAELTTYRIADQPEAELFRDTLLSVDQTLSKVAKRIDSLDTDLELQRTAMFDEFASERSAAITELAEKFGKERSKAIDQAFDRLRSERHALLDDIQNRQGALTETFDDLRNTLDASTRLAAELTSMIGSLDKMVARFDSDATGTGAEAAAEREPLDIDALTAAAIETAKTAKELTILLDRANETMDNPKLGSGLSVMNDFGERIVDRMFWRGVILIGIFFAGLVVLRLTTSRRMQAPMN